MLLLGFMDREMDDIGSTVDTYSRSKGLGTEREKQEGRGCICGNLGRGIDMMDGHMGKCRCGGGWGGT